ncbi:polyhydroxyalkanoate granule-associated phasin [Derxia lacustris]|uniref:polyhydroxyalkanoate granule-associated phasin n=1 Tax=Derxia lacustris TaxID=764842 RepID=UPI000A172855|nr:polyhydroxyalkanoate granule-associated phasin [Derxia lacustris]
MASDFGGVTAWNNWIKACEIGWSAPQVVAMRLGAMAAAGSNPSARDRAENVRMGQEKLQAFSESWVGVGSRMQRMQLDMAMRCWKEGLRWWTQPWWLGNAQVFPRLDLMPMNYAPLFKAALDPVHRRVTGNVRRLAARRA